LRLRSADCNAGCVKMARIGVEFFRFYTVLSSLRTMDIDFKAAYAMEPWPRR
jgi:hypothetical protein